MKLEHSGRNGALAVIFGSLVILAAPSQALAQAADPSPSPTASATQPQIPNQPRTGVPAPAPNVPAFSHIPAIDLIPQSTFATGTDYTPGQPVVEGSIKIGGKITIPILPKLSASYQHGYIDETIGNPGEELNGLVNDPIDDFRLNAAVSKGFNAALGYFYRHRTCCPSTGPTGLSVHEGYLELDYAFPAIEALNGATFSVTGRATQTLAHHATPLATLLANPQVGPDEGNRLWPTGGASLSVPVDRKNGFSVFGTYTYAKDYFDYNPIAFWYNIVDYGFTRVVNPVLSFTLDSSNLQQHRQGYPFAGFNTIHRTKVVLSADIHIAPK